MTRFIDRPPRIQPELPQGDVVIPTPPADETREQSIVQQLIPVITIAGYFVIMLMSRSGGGFGRLLIIPMTLAVLVSFAYSYYTNREAKREQLLRDQAYDQRLNAARREVLQQHDMQRRFYIHNHPNPEQSLLIGIAASRADENEAAAQLAGRLWERRVEDKDFCSLRLGIGVKPSTVSYKLSESGDAQRPQMLEAQRLLDDAQFVSDVPITVPLRERPPAVGSIAVAEKARHAIGIIGDHTTSVYRYIWSLTADFVTLQSPNDVTLRVLGTGAAADQWDWIRPLPHANDDQGQRLICFESAEDLKGDKDSSKVRAFLHDLRQTLDDRKLRLEDRESPDEDVTLPFQLIIVDLLSSLQPNSRLSDLETDPGIAMLLEDGAQLGAAVIFLVPTQSKVPSGCQAVIEVIEERANNEIDVSNASRVAFRYAETGVNAPRYLGKADVIRREDALMHYANAIMPLAVRKSYGSDFPFPLHLLDMVGVDSMEQLREKVVDNWQESVRPDSADWLRTSIGAMSGGEERKLKFSADADGVHGLIAGTTGSGKSELLMTMILSLAINYDPSIVNFVLVDFKGGGAFKPLENLPHVVDLVTNLGDAAVERMFAAIRAELDRRAGVNTYTDMKDIVGYRKRGLHLPDGNGNYGRPVTVKGRQLHTAPYPHLFIFIDEYAEMIAANPEYKEQLDSITRLGRALGVSLILAAQRPTGVTDQMRANIKFRLALRVENREDSIEVLRRPDAAHLPNSVAGRGYLQVGSDNLEMVQIAWSGAAYKNEEAERDMPGVVWFDPATGQYAGLEDEEPSRVYDEVVRLLAKVAEDESAPQRRPWPNFLPQHLSLQTQIDASYLEDDLNLVSQDSSGSTIVGRNEMRHVMLNPAVDRWLTTTMPTWRGLDWRNAAMRAVVGLVDNPYESEQHPLVLDFRRGHGVVFGASGWGKTALLRTVITSLTATHSPDALHVGILDVGGRQMGLFRDLPHVGAIITSEEAERVQRLLRKLDDELEQRKRRLSDANKDDLYSYNADDTLEIMPAVLVVIDNFAEFRESFDDSMPLLISLVREARAYGIHFLVSAELPHVVSGKLFSLLTERLALKLSSQTEYSTIMGRSVRALDELPGRGVIRVGRRVLEFQAALSAGSTAMIVEERDSLALRQYVQIQAAAAAEWPSERMPMPVRTLATTVTLHELFAIKELSQQGKGKIRPIIGIDDLNLLPWRLDLPNAGPHCMVIGGPNSGKTTLLRSLILSLANENAPEDIDIVLIDYQQRLYRYDGDYDLGDLPHVVATISNSDKIESLIATLREKCRELKASGEREIYVVIDNYMMFSEDVQEHRGMLPQLAMLAREYGPEGLHFILAGTAEITRTSDDKLRKQVQVPRYGLALDVEGVERMNGRIPRALMTREQPLGRGFVVKSGRANVIQFATPYTEPDEVEASLDLWISKIDGKYGEYVKAETVEVEYELSDASDAVIDSVPRPALKENGVRPVSQPVEAMPKNSEGDSAEIPDPTPINTNAKVNIAALRAQIEARAGFSVETLSAEDIVNVAISLGIITEEAKEI